MTEILKDPVTPNNQVVAAHKRLLDRAAELDLEVTGMSHEWFLPEGCKQEAEAIPRIIDYYHPSKNDRFTKFKAQRKYTKDVWMYRYKYITKTGWDQVGNEYDVSADLCSIAGLLFLCGCHGIIFIVFKSIHFFLRKSTSRTRNIFHILISSWGMI